MTAGQLSSFLELRMRPLPSLRAVFLALLLLAAFSKTYAQTGDWVWMSGGQGAFSPYPATDIAGGAYPVNSPGIRAYAATWTDTEGNFWLFGGEAVDSNGKYGPMSDLWMYSPSTNLWTLEGGTTVSAQSGVFGQLNVGANTNNPGSRYMASAWTDRSGNFWLFGGTGYDSAGTLGYLGDLWMFSPGNGEWTWVGGSNTANSPASDVNFFAPGLASTANLPGSRMEAMSWVDAKGNFWLFGGAGYGPTGPTQTPAVSALNDIWEYIPSARTWTFWGGQAYANYGTQGQPSATNQPGFRGLGTTWVDSSGVLWLYGGYGYDTLNLNFLGDLWSYNTSTNLWTWVGGSQFALPLSLPDPGVLGTPSATTTPGNRVGANAWVDSSGNAWLFGGYSKVLPGYLFETNDLWEYTPANNEWTWVSGTSSDPSGYIAALQSYGTQGVPDPSNVPGGRASAATWTDKQGNFWLFGGTSDNPTIPDFIRTLFSFIFSYDDVWVFLPPGPAGPQAAVSPTKLQFSAPANSAAVSQTLTLANTGTGTLTLSGISFAGPDVSLFSQTNDCGSSVAAGASCTIQVSFTAAGAGIDSATLVIANNGRFDPSVSLTAISKAITALTLQTNPSATGVVLSPVTLTATLSPSSEPADPTQGPEIKFYDGTQFLGYAQLFNGTATLTTTSLPIGANQLSASYGGDAYFLPATSAQVPFTVTYPPNLKQTSTTLALLAGGQAATSVPRTSKVNLTATVTSGGAPVSPGIVAFCDAAYASCVGQGLIGTAQTNAQGVATLPMRFGAGTHQVEATFQPQFLYAASSSAVAPISVSDALTTAAVASSGTAGDTTLTATITGFGPAISPTGTVQFIDTSNNNAVVGTVPLASAVANSSLIVGTPLPNTAGEGWYTVSADFNGDGIPDVAVIDAGSDPTYTIQVPETIQVYLGNGDGTFKALAPMTVIPGTPAGTISEDLFDSATIAVGDFNQDGIPDLAVGVNQAPNASVAILLGKGDGTFTTQPAQLTVFSVGVVMPVVADFNGDGIADVLITVASLPLGTFQSDLYFGNGDGTFTLSPTQTPIKLSAFGQTDFSYFAVPGDFNGDGIPDVFAASTAYADSFLNVGNGTFHLAATPVSLPGIDYQVPSFFEAVGDFNRDGKQDVAISNPDTNQANILLGNGDGSFQLEAATPTFSSTGQVAGGNVVSTDINGDGIDDVVLIENRPVVHVFLSNGDGTFTSDGSPLVVGDRNTNGGGLAAGDFHNSGRSDLVVSLPDDFTVNTITNQLTETAAVTLANARLDGVGPHQIEAVYSGDSVFAASTSPAVAVTGVALTATSAKLTATPATAQVGTSVTLQASVTPATGTVTPTGNVSFYDGAKILGTLPVNASGVASMATAAFAAGTHNITAVYSGDAANQGSMSAAVAVTVSAPAPAASLSPSGPLSFTATAGATSAAQTVTLTNTGTGTLTVSNIAFAGTNASSFAQTSPCLSLTAGASCPIAITFTPSAPGSYSASLRVSDNEPSSPQTVALTGSGNAKATPTIAWATPAAISYGTALSATQLDATSPVAGSFVYTPAAGTVLSGGIHTLAVTFTPSDTTDYTTATASVQLTVNPATPTIAWATPAALAYGTALSATQLDATSTVAGAFAYTPAAGAILSAGTHTLSVTFTPTDRTDYATATATVQLTVNQAKPSISWATPAAISYGTALSTTQLDATSPVAGTFAYNPAVGAILSVGTHTLSVTFTPTDTTDYTSATASVQLTVNQATPTIAWATPAAIPYSTALSATQLDATSPVAGSFVYTPAVGAILSAGTHTLSATFTPTDTTDYAPAVASVQLTVNQATPPIAWATPTAITYGTALSATQLDATSPVGGSFVYTPAVGAIERAGTDKLSVTFTPADTTDYATATATVQLTVNQATPTIAWATPAAIPYGTALSATQLNATSPIAGSFTYTPAVGAILTVGTHTLSATFTPTDGTDYATATATVPLTVNQATPSIAWPTPAAIAYGTSLSGTQLDATSPVAGSFVYTPAAGTVLAAGLQTLTVAFTPTDTTDYTTATASVKLQVTQATPAIAWNPAALTYGAPLTSAQLDASANVAGSFTYTPAAGTVLSAGSHTLTASFTPTDMVDYASATANVTLVVAQAATTVTWSTPAAIVYGTPLSATQLDASAKVAGTFAYTPSSGVVLPVGAQKLMATFTPADAADYQSSSASVTLMVTPAVLTVAPVAATRAYGAANPPFTYTIAGFVNGDSASAVSGAPVEGTTATQTSAPGAYPITLAQGTLAAANYTFSLSSSTLTVTQAASTTALTLSSSTLYLGNPETLSVAVASSTTGTPTGTVTFSDGTAALGTAPLSNGQASITTSSLAAGQNSFTATYSGDADFSPSSATATASVSAVPPDFTFAAGSDAVQTVAPGQSATFTFNLSPTQSNYPGTVTFAVAGLPAGATAVFSPSTLAAASGPQSVTLTIQAGLQIAAWGGEKGSLPALALGLVLLPFAALRRLRRPGHTLVRRATVLLFALATLAASWSLTACGSTTGFFDHAMLSFPLTVTATSGGDQHQVTITLNVQ
jgi:hypothetical protein